MKSDKQSRQGNKQSRTRHPIISKCGGDFVINAQQIHEAMEKNKAVLLEMASEMVRTKSITGNEYEIGQVFKKWLERFGFDTSIVEKEERHPNVIGEWRGAEGPGFVYNGHLDTLPAADSQLWSFDPFGGEVKDGYIQGRGTGDMKCPNAAFMMAMKLLKDVGFSPKGTIHMVYTCDEQVGGARGIQYLLDEGYIQGEYGINGEPSEMKLLLKHKGVQQYVIKVHGKSYAASFSGKDKFFEQTGIDALEKSA